jgi:hypothetical protein
MWLAVGAVPSEPFSTVNSLLTGKITGNFADSGRIWSPHKRDKVQSAGFSDECTDSGTGNVNPRNREFISRNREFFERSRDRE